MINETRKNILSPDIREIIHQRVPSEGWDLRKRSFEVGKENEGMIWMVPVTKQHWSRS